MIGILTGLILFTKSTPIDDVVGVVMHAYMNEVASYPNNMRPKVTILDQWQSPKEPTSIQQWIGDALSERKDLVFRLQTRYQQGERTSIIRSGMKANNMEIKSLSKAKNRCGAESWQADIQTPFPSETVRKWAKVELDGTTTIEPPVFSQNREYALVSIMGSEASFAFSASYLLAKVDTSWKILTCTQRSNYWSWCGVAPTLEDMKKEGWKRQRAK